MALIRLGGGQLAARLLVAAFVLWPRTADGAAPRGFVARAGSGFVLDGAPFHVVGANQCVLRRGTRARSRRDLRGLAKTYPAVRVRCARARAALRPLAAAPHGAACGSPGLAPRTAFGLRLRGGRLSACAWSHSGGE